MLEGITPVILVYNEEQNIRRCLGKLRWAKDIVVVDSFSQDKTLAILKEYPQVRLFQRHFDNYANQWNFSLSRTEITTEWILSLDADYLLTEEFILEMTRLCPADDVKAFLTNFRYCVWGQPLRASLYPPRIVLFRKNYGNYYQDGHRQRLKVDGKVDRLHMPILHDDRKPLGRWLSSQKCYARLEAKKLAEAGWRELSWPSRIRKIRGLMPFLIGFYSLLIKGSLWSGKSGIYYTLQRIYAETLISLTLLEMDLKNGPRKFK